MAGGYWRVITMKRKVLIFFVALWLAAAPAFGMNAIAYFNLGLESSWAYKKIEYFTKALDLDPGLARAYAMRGILYYFQEKYGNVIDDYEHYTRLMPKDAGGHRMLGMGYLKSGLYKAAIHNFSRAIEIDPGLSDPYAYRAEAHRLLGDHPRAIADATRAISLPGHLRVTSSAYSTRSKSYRALGRIEDADADISKSVDLDPRYAILRYLTGNTDLKQIRGAGLMCLIGIAFVLIFRLRLKPPKKDK